MAKYENDEVLAFGGVRNMIQCRRKIGSYPLKGWRTLGYHIRIDKFMISVLFLGSIICEISIDLNNISMHFNIAAIVTVIIWVCRANKK